MVAGVVLALAIAGAIVLWMSAGEDVDSLAESSESLIPLTAPGEVTAELEAGVEQAIYRRADQRGSGRVRCRVSDEDGEPVSLSGVLGFTTLTVGSAEYVTAFNFEVPRSGRYEVACDSRRGETELLVGEKVKLGEIFGAVGGIFAGIGTLILGVMICLAIVTPVAIMRSRDRKRRAREGADVAA